MLHPPAPSNGPSSAQTAPHVIQTIVPVLLGLVGTAIAANIVTALQDYEIPVFQSLSQRVVFAECASAHMRSEGAITQLDRSTKAA